ncbi:MAG: hypothetical protein OYH76_17215 [Defluviicoccus sp.]|nr:hypothetical protein [Defluviicoccus sp.]MDE0277639.1 hypothetical protein [Defluviicoccus sp.]
MTPELIAILAVGVALAGLMLRGHHGLGARMDGLGARMDRLDSRMDGLAEVMREVRDRLSRLEGKVDFLEGYIVRRNEAGAPAE